MTKQQQKKDRYYTSLIKTLNQVLSTFESAPGFIDNTESIDRTKKTIAQLEAGYQLFKANNQ